MNIVCLAVGKKHDPNIADAIDDYTSRLQHYVTMQWQIIPAAQGKMSEDQTKRVESAALLAKLSDDDRVVLLDETGTQLTSEGLAGFLERMDTQNVRRVVFIIGGAYGVTQELKDRAQFVWALSSLVFPHQLVRLVLAEQLYRACTIRRGESYHHK